MQLVASNLLEHSFVMQNNSPNRNSAKVRPQFLIKTREQGQGLGEAESLEVCLHFRERLKA